MLRFSELFTFNYQDTLILVNVSESSFNQELEAEESGMFPPLISVFIKINSKIPLSQDDVYCIILKTESMSKNMTEICNLGGITEVFESLKTVEVTPGAYETSLTYGYRRA